MTLISRLAEKSWMSPGLDGLADPADYRPPAATVGLCAFLVVATVIFALLSLAYLMRMGFAHGLGDHGLGGDWQPMPKLPMLWINTGVLAASSLAWEAARRSAHTGTWPRIYLMATIGGMLGMLFLCGQLLLWRQYRMAGYFLATNPANAFFYLLTAVHGLHLAGGQIAFVRILGQMTGPANTARICRNIQLCAIYWHFLLLVWIVLAGLLLLT